MKPSLCISQLAKSVFRVLFCAAMSFLLLSWTSAQAQEKGPKYELGVLFATLHVSEKSDSDSGLGFRFTYNFNDYVGVEAETTYFPQRREGGNGNERQGLFGVRAGKRNSRFGVFAKARPGVTHFYQVGNTPGPSVFERGQTRFSLDVGGVVEYYPAYNLSFRVDVGDTMVHFKRGDFFDQGFGPPILVQRTLSHNLQVNVGVALRF